MFSRNSLLVRDEANPQHPPKTATLAPIVTSQQPIVTSQPSKVTAEPLIVTSQPPRGMPEPLIVTSQPQLYMETSHTNVLTSQPLKSTSWPPLETSQSLILMSQPPLVTSQPPLVTSQHPLVMSQPPLVTSQPPLVTSLPPLLTSQPQAKMSQPPVVTSQPTTVLFQRQIVSGPPRIQPVITSQPLGNYDSPWLTAPRHGSRAAETNIAPSSNRPRSSILPSSMLNSSLGQASKTSVQNGNSTQLWELFGPLRQRPASAAESLTTRPAGGSHRPGSYRKSPQRRLTERSQTIDSAARKKSAEHRSEKDGQTLRPKKRTKFLDSNSKVLVQPTKTLQATLQIGRNIFKIIFYKYCLLSPRRKMRNSPTFSTFRLVFLFLLGLWQYNKEYFLPIYSSWLNSF